MEKESVVKYLKKNGVPAAIEDGVIIASYYKGQKWKVVFESLKKMLISIGYTGSYGVKYDKKMPDTSETSAASFEQISLF